MSNTKTTLISHVFNEEYLLPFWLTHHKQLFDEIIIVDYNSTDKSIEICKSICPNCIIKKTRNCNFEAEKVDNEIMDIDIDCMQSTRTNLPANTYPNLVKNIRVVIFNGDWDACEPAH